jgi:SAM-dependent methyltransferase
MSQPQLFDRRLVAARRLRALKQAPADADFLLSRVLEDMAERLSTVNRRFSRGLALGGGTRHLARMLAATGQVDQVIRADSLETGSLETGSLDQVRDGPDLVAHEDALPFAPASFDLIASALTLQTIDDLPGVLIQIRRALKPDGLFLAALAGGDTLTELRESLAAAEVELTGGISPRIIPFMEVRDLGGLLQRAGLALPVTDADRLIVRYPSMFDLMRDLRAFGATNPLVERSRSPHGRAFFVRAAEIYADRFSDPDGRIRATFHILSASAWAPSDTQQQPARRGSAKIRLADALGATEWTTGEKAPKS